VTKGKKSGEVKMIKNGAVVEAHQVRTPTEVYPIVLTGYSGTVSAALGRRSEMSWTLSGKAASSCTKEKSTTTCSTSISRMASLPSSYHTMSQASTSIPTRGPSLTKDTENPFTAAQRFLQANDLSLEYIDQVVKFIETNTAGVNIGTGNDEYRDPFTG